jgi:hypothetical protein
MSKGALMVYRRQLPPSSEVRVPGIENWKPTIGITL